MKDLLRDTWRAFSERGGRLLSGAIAFYALLSIVPLLVIALRLATLVAREDQARRVMAAQIARWVGREGSQTIAGMLDVAVRHSATPRGAGFLSVAVLVYGSTRLFNQLRRALNLLWELPPQTLSGTRARLGLEVQRRLMSFLLVALVGLMLLVMIGLQTGVAAVQHALPPELRSASLRPVVNGVASFGMTTVMFTFIFRFLPDARIHTRDLLVGATVTAAGFAAASSLVALYVGHSASASVFGAAGSVVILLMWVHYAAHVFFLGAAFTAAYARKHGRAIQPL